MGCAWGPAGAGKSYVLNLIRKELFETLLGWKQGEEFQVVTLQAVMAEDLNGDTIHHAFGLNWQGAGDERISPHMQVARPEHASVAVALADH